VEQRERRRLAELLHDGLQQMLVAAKFRVTEARRRVQEDAALEQNLNHIDELLTQSIETSRSLTTELSPPVLQELGLVPALGWLADFMATKHDLRVDVRTAGKAEPSSPELRLLLFPVARELLFNVVKHAGVQRAHISLEREGRCLRLKVTDQGCGFDLSKWQTLCDAPGRGFGLLNVQNRVELAGGKLQVDSAPGQGTRVTVTVPV
jgi:signal transduction histidine kinase